MIQVASAALPCIPGTNGELHGRVFDVRGNTGQGPELPAVTADDEAYPLDIFLGPKLFDSVIEQATVAGTVAMVSGMLTEQREAPAETRISATVERLNVVVAQAGPWTVIQVRRDPQSP